MFQRALCYSFVLLLATLCGLAQAASIKKESNLPAGLEPAKVVEDQFRGKTGTLTLVVELEGEPAARRYAETLQSEGKKAAKNVVASAIAENAAQQKAMRETLKGFGGLELYSMQRVLNAIVIRIDASRVQDLRAIPGVKRVSIAPRHTIENSTSVPFIGANTVWDTTGELSTLGLTGSGVTIAIIDTGVDYLHRNFAGSGNYAGQTDPTTIADTGGWPQGRVINGWDFAGDSYNGSNAPVPDPDPTDCGGHGSHVAGSAAGSGVSGGATYAGGYDNLTAGALAGFDIGPGVAPEASIVALKVFGCAGSTDLTLQAIEYATDPNGDLDFSDHYDVINMSLGSSYGFPGAQLDAVDNAVAAGVIVVTSAGNSGDTHYITGTPGSATSAISTAAISDSGIINAGFAVDPDGDNDVDTTYLAVHQSNYSPAIAGTVPAVVAKLQKPTPSALGCAPADFATFTPGNVALITRGTCSGKLKAFNAQTAGATAVVIVALDNNPVSLADDPAVSAITIPVVMIASGAGAAIDPSIATAKGQLVQSGSNAADIIAGFSSRGPRRNNLTGEVQLKPDISAPGVNIISTKTCYTGAGGCNGTESAPNSGTSMASPHIAGVMALLRQLHPTWTVAQLKALVMNTANHDVSTPNILTGLPAFRTGTMTSGAGRVDTVAATNDDVFAYATDNPEGVSVTFINDVLNGTTPSDSKTVTVENKNAFSVTYNLSIDTVTNVAGVSFSVTPSSVTVPALSSGTVTVTVNYTASAMTHTIDPNSSTAQVSFNRHFLSEESGFLYLDAATGATTDLRVPLYADARPASDMDSPALVNTGASTGVVSIPLTGTGVDSGAGATLYRSRVAGFELLHTSPEIDPDPNLWDGGDMEYIGASSDVPVGGSRTYFGISMYGDWDTPRMREVQLCLDLNQDGTGGAFGDGTDWCMKARPALNGTNYTDAFMVYLVDINNFLGSGANAEFSITEYQNVNPTVLDTRVFNTNVMFLASGTTPAYWNTLIGAATVKYTGGNTTDPGQAFNFKIKTVDLNDPLVLDGTNAFTDVTPVLTFDPTNAVFSPAEGFFGVAGRMIPMVDDLNATAFDWSYNLSQPDGQADILMLHLYNQSGDRVDLVTIHAPPSVPVLVSPANGSTVNDATPTFDWNDSTGGGGASNYQIQVDNNADFSSPEIDSNPADSEFTPGSPLADDTYNWRVRSAGASGAVSAWSTVWSFTLDSDLLLLTVAGAGTGTGTMTSTTTINCTSTAGSTSGDCTELTDPATVFAITAAPDDTSDFGGWTGCDSVSGTDNEICNVTLSADKTVTADFDVEPTLTVAGTGLGSGTMSDGFTISCTSTAGTESNDCSQQADTGTVFAITATADATSDFSGWSGCDSTSGTNNEICNVTLTADKIISAGFNVEPTLSVSGTGTGIGTMIDTTPGSTISCTSTAGSSSGDCSEQTDTLTVFAVTATPDAASDFAGWTGCDSTSGTNNEVCNFILTADRSISAAFNVEPTLSVAGTGAGTGTMTDTGSINCTSTVGTESGTCSVQTDSGTVFAITATPDATSDFNGWTGCDSVSGANNEVCNLTLTADTTVTADFIIEPTLTVAGAGLGTGSMSDTPGSTINCTSTAGVSSGDCSEQTDTGTVYAITADPAFLSQFNGWVGCDFTSGANNEICNVTLNSDTTVTGTFEIVPYLLFDDFEDDVMNWDVAKGSCQEVSGTLICGSPTLVRVFAPQPWLPSGLNGCTMCTVEVDLQTAGGLFGKVILQDWYVDKQNGVELIVKEGVNRIVLKQRAGGTIVAKKSAKIPIDPGTTYKVAVEYTGSAFVVSVNDTVLMTVPTSVAPSAGNVGFKVVRTTGTFEEIRVSD